MRDNDTITRKVCVDGNKLFPGKEWKLYCKRGKFAGLNIHGFSPMKYSREYLCGVLASSLYYLTIAKYSRENFCGTLKNRKNHESLKV